jgi:hypothetical protein
VLSRTNVDDDETTAESQAAKEDINPVAVISVAHIRRLDSPQGRLVATGRK